MRPSRRAPCAPARSSQWPRAPTTRTRRPSAPSPRSPRPDDNDPAYRAAALPASNGIATADGLARFYAALIGEPDGTRLFTPATVDLARAEASAGPDRTLVITTRFGLGYMLHGTASHSQPAWFGHPGRGGPLGFADPESGIAFGYITNGFRKTVTADPPGRRRWYGRYGRRCRRSRPGRVHVGAEPGRGRVVVDPAGAVPDTPAILARPFRSARPSPRGDHQNARPTARLSLAHRRHLLGAGSTAFRTYRTLLRHRLPPSHWRDAMGGAEGPGELGGAGETPAGGDGMDRHRAQRRVGEVAAGVLQPLISDVGGHGEALGLEEAVQMAARDVVRGGDPGGGQLLVAQIPADERLDAQGQRPAAGLRWQQGLGVQGAREDGRDQVGEDRSQSGAVRRLVGTGVRGQLDEELPERADSLRPEIRLPITRSARFAGSATSDRGISTPTRLTGSAPVCISYDREEQFVWMSLTRYAACCLPQAAAPSPAAGGEVVHLGIGLADQLRRPTEDQMVEGRRPDRRPPARSCAGARGSPPHQVAGQLHGRVRTAHALRPRLEP